MSPYLRMHVLKLLPHPPRLLYGWTPGVARRLKGIGLAGGRGVIPGSASGKTSNSFIRIMAMVGRQFVPWQ